MPGEREMLVALAERVERASGPDDDLSQKAHLELGWHSRRVTRLGLNGRTPGSYLWFPPNAEWGATGRKKLPCLSGPKVRKRVAEALRHLAAQPRGEGGDV